MNSCFTFDFFDNEDLFIKNLYEKYPASIEPTWRHIWFFRYLRISPSFIKLNKIIRENEKDNEVMEAELSKIPQVDAVIQTYKHLNSVWELEFPIWWYDIGRYEFDTNHTNKTSIKELFFWPANKYLNDQSLNEVKVKLDDHFSEVMSVKYFPNHVGLTITLRSSLKDTLNEIKQFLSSNYSFSGEGSREANFKFHKSKIQKHSVISFYKILERRANQKKLNLLDLAIDADVLKSSIAGYKYSESIDMKRAVAESIRSGTSRQIKNAILIAENAARGKFPCLDPIDHLQPDYNELLDVYMAIKNQYQYLDYDSKYQDKMVDIIKFLEKYGYDESAHIIKRLKL